MRLEGGETCNRGNSGFVKYSSILHVSPCLGPDENVMYLIRNAYRPLEDHGIMPKDDELVLPRSHQNID